MNCDVIGLNGAVRAAHSFNACDLETLISQIIHRTRKNIVSFAFEFRSLAGRPLFYWEHGRVHAVRSRLAGKILGAKLNL